jgi:membrane protein YdbS with pleckstrin-like domain
MNGTLQEALQGGKANPKMKTVWMLRWSARFIFSLMFFMFFFIFRIFDFFSMSDILMLVLICVLLPIILGFLISILWASFYWNKYQFVLGQERITITCGVIGKRVVNIPYERVQNVNIWRGVLDRIFGLYSVQIETAGGFGIRGTGGYGSRRTAEGEILGLTNPEPIAEFILSKSKGNSGLGEKIPKRNLENDEKIKLLEERFIKGEISEKTYEELKRRYGSS